MTKKRKNSIWGPATMTAAEKKRSRRMVQLRMRLERERNKPRPSQAKISKMMDEYKSLATQPNPKKALPRGKWINAKIRVT